MSADQSQSLYDSEILTMEVLGAYLSLNQDSAMLTNVRRHNTHCFPGLFQVYRTTCVRQAANLWRVKAHFWQVLLDMLPHDPQLAIRDSLPLPVCQFARAPCCRSFRGTAAYGKEHVVKQTYFGFRWHARLRLPAVLARVCLPPNNLADPDVAPLFSESMQGPVVSVRLFLRPRLPEELRQEDVLLLALSSHITRLLAGTQPPRGRQGRPPLYRVQIPYDAPRAS